MNEILEVKTRIIKGENIDQLLIGCACYGNLNTVTYLVEIGADVNVNYKGCHILLLVAIKGRFDIVKFLIDKGSEVSDRILKYCIHHENLEMVKYIYAKRADIHFNCDELLIYSSTIEIAKFLIENGADIYACNHRVLKEFSLIKERYQLEIITDYFLSLYSEEKLKESLENEELKTELLKFILKRDLTRYGKVISVYRELGIDIYDLVEKET